MGRDRADAPQLRGAVPVQAPAGRQSAGRGLWHRQVLPDGAGQQSTLLGVDHAGALLANAATKFPPVPTAKHDLQALPYRAKFDGVLCVDAMKFVPPEDWPPVLERFRRALRPGGWLYLTVELAPGDRVRAANQAARRSGLPVVDGEVIWEGPDGYYHHYPSMGQVRSWLADAGFTIDEEAEGPWHEQGYAYHHVLARLAAAPG